MYIILGNAERILTNNIVDIFCDLILSIPMVGTMFYLLKASLGRTLEVFAFGKT